MSVERVVRILLGAVGVAGLLYGSWLVVSTTPPDDLFGLGVWLVAALILHDGIAAPIVVLVSVLLRRSGRRLPRSALAVIQGALVIAAVLAVVVLPEVRAKQLGPRNPTVLPLDYAAHLGIAWAILAALTLLICTALVLADGRHPAPAPTPTRDR